MDPCDLNDLVFPFADFQGDETSDRPSSESLSPGIDGRYKSNGTSLFDTQYIDPALLEAPNPIAMGDFMIDHSPPAMQYTQNELSPYHPEWQSPSMGFEQQQNLFQSQQQDLPEGAFPNALDTSALGDTNFDWFGARQGSPENLDHIANQPTGSLASSQRETCGVRFCFFGLTLIGRSGS